MCVYTVQYVPGPLIFADTAVTRASIILACTEDSMSLLGLSSSSLVLEGTVLCGPNTKQCKQLIRKFPLFDYVQFHFVCDKYKHLLSASVVHQMAAHIILELAIWVRPGFASLSSCKTDDEIKQFARSKLRI